MALMGHTGSGTMVIIFLLSLIFWPLVAYFKRKRQFGKSWTRPISATVKINDLLLTCTHCKCNQFHKREALVGTTFVSYFGFHFLNQSGAAYECKECGQLQWFRRPKETEVIPNSVDL